MSEMSKETDAELARWQQAIYELVKDKTGLKDIDGAGCDSGDALDFTLDEIRQGFDHLHDKANAEAAERRHNSKVLWARIEESEHFLEVALKAQKLKDKNIEELSQQVCDDCDGSGVYYLNDKPQVCICVGETKPYQVLEDALKSIKSRETSIAGDHLRAPGMSADPGGLVAGMVDEAEEALAAYE